MKTDFSKETWPVCYRTQKDGGIPEGPFDEPNHTGIRWMAWGLVIGLLLVGPALCDLYEMINH